MKRHPNPLGPPPLVSLKGDLLSYHISHTYHVRQDPLRVVIPPRSSHSLRRPSDVVHSIPYRRNPKWLIVCVTVLIRGCSLTILCHYTFLQVPYQVTSNPYSGSSIQSPSSSDRTFPTPYTHYGGNPRNVTSVTRLSRLGTEQVQYRSRMTYHLRVTYKRFVYLFT